MKTFTDTIYLWWHGFYFREPLVFSTAARFLRRNKGGSQTQTSRFPLDPTGCTPLLTIIQQ